MPVARWVVLTSPDVRSRSRTAKSPLTRVCAPLVRQGEFIELSPEKLGVFETLTTGQADATWIFSHHEGLIAERAGAAISTSLISSHQPPIAAIEESAEIDLGELDIPMYDLDAVLRRSPALQATSVARRARGEL